MQLTDENSGLLAVPEDARTLAEEALAREELRRAVDQLPERLRLPLVLHFFEDLSGSEVAGILGCSENAAWKRIYSGRRALRKHLPSFGAPVEERR